MQDHLKPPPRVSQDDMTVFCSIEKEAWSTDAAAGSTSVQSFSNAAFSCLLEDGPVVSSDHADSQVTNAEGKDDAHEGKDEVPEGILRVTLAGVCF